MDEINIFNIGKGDLGSFNLLWSTSFSSAIPDGFRTAQLKFDRMDYDAFYIICVGERLFSQGTSGSGSSAPTISQYYNAYVFTGIIINDSSIPYNQSLGLPKRNNDYKDNLYRLVTITNNGIFVGCPDTTVTGAQHPGTAVLPYYIYGIR